MFNPTKLVIDAFVDKLEAQYHRLYGDIQSQRASVIRWGAHMALESIANSDALYHDVEHTVMVSSVGLEILKGRHLSAGNVTPTDWVHFVLSLLCHDVGYIRGLVDGDANGVCVINLEGETISLPPGATDAYLTPYHVDRGEIFVRSRFSSHPELDADCIVANIKNTRFPVPQGGDHEATNDYPGLVRAADLIGQLADPNYMRKLPHLFHEFRETGANLKLGYDNPDDLRDGYASFYWNMVRPYIGDALRYLAVTQDGKQWIANLHSHVFTRERPASVADSADTGFLWDD